MTGPVEEGGKAAGAFMTIMKDQPLSLALVVMNLALVFLFWMAMSNVRQTRQQELTEIFATQRETNTLLARCVDPSALDSVQGMVRHNRDDIDSLRKFLEEQFKSKN